MVLPVDVPRQAGQGDAVPCLVVPTRQRQAQQQVHSLVLAQEVDI
jgi:hypothetical protein